MIRFSKENIQKSTGTAVVCAMRNLTSGLFEHLGIVCPLDVDKRVNYTQRFLRELALKRYKTFLMDCKELAKGIAGD